MEDYKRISFYKDARRNYMVISSGSKEEPANYQYRMLQVNNIEGLLPCSVRNVNGERLLYYEITSKQSLSGLYGSGVLHEREVRNILTALLKIGEELERYLLDSTNILMKPDTIYYDYEKDSYMFCYCPELVEEAGYLALFTFLEERVDATERGAVDLVYRLLTMAKEPNFILQQSMLQSATPKTETPVEEVFEKETSKKELWTEPEPLQDSILSSETKEYGRQEEEIIYPEDALPEREQVQPKETTDSSRGSVRWMGATCLLLVSGVLLFLLYRVYPFPQQYLPYIPYVILGLLGGSILCALIGTILGHRKSAQKEEQEMTEQKSFIPMEPTGEERLYSHEKESSRKLSSSTSEETVFLFQHESENRLYGTGLFSKLRIDLQHLPCTVGKMEGYVDQVISDSSISRVHARFSKEDVTDQVIVTDLNSTNGTFLNGVRLMPNESLFMEPGDEIRLGSITFRYQ